jgi:uncharacterized membrane protein HdeD (DUF308 family)
MSQRFVAMVPLVWVLPSFALVFGAVLCAQAIKSERPLKPPARNWTVVGFALFVYAVLTFVYFYRTTGGASSVTIVDGQYVSMYKSRIIRIITEHEYRMFPNLWTRVMSAWIGMMAVFILMQLPSVHNASDRDVS